MRALSSAAACCAMIVVIPGALAQTPGAGFRVLDLLPGTGGAYAWGYAVSDGGKIIVGIAARVTPGRPVRWDSAGRIETLPGGPTSLGRAADITPDGRTIAGNSDDQQGSLSAIVWRDGFPEYLPSLPEAWSPYVSGISNDGSTVSGDMTLPSTAPFSGFVRWVDGKIEDMTSLPGDALTSISAAISGDGRYVIGLGYAAGGRAIRADQHVEDLGDLPGASGGIDGRIAHGANRDGSRIVGIARSVAVSGGSEAFQWTRVTGMIGLGAVPARRLFSSGECISDDGRIVGGRSGYRIPYEDQAFLWDAVHGIRSLNDIVDAHGLDRDGWFIEAVNGLDSTGTAMTGVIRKNGEQRAFLVTLPPWCHADCDGSGDIDFNDFLCFLNRYNRAQADPRAHPVDFVYCDFALDDTIDFADVLEYLRLYSAGCGR